MCIRDREETQFNNIRNITKKYMLIFCLDPITSPFVISKRYCTFKILLADMHYALRSPKYHFTHSYEPSNIITHNTKLPLYQVSHWLFHVNHNIDLKWNKNNTSIIILRLYSWKGGLNFISCNVWNHKIRDDNIFRSEKYILLNVVLFYKIILYMRVFRSLKIHNLVK